MSIGSALWKGRKHYLDKMTLGELVAAYFAYPAIQLYLALAVVGVAVAAVLGGEPWRVAAAVAATPPVYALTWYVLHRFVLHGRFLYRSPRTAGLWKRVHFDHHRDPNDLEVLFGAPWTTLPTMAAVTGPLGWIIAGPAGAAAAFTTALITTCCYEFCHCIQHLRFTPRWAFLRRIKRLHLLHHFHNEHGNYGITNFFWDRAFGSYYDDARQVPRSPTIHNLGYTDAESERFPWVKALSQGSTAGDA